MCYKNNIFTLADAYTNRKKICVATAIAYSSNNPNLFKRIKAGGTMTIDTYQRIIHWFSANWPSDLAWPDEIERPLITEFEQSPNSANGGCDVPFRHNPPNPPPVSKVTDTIKEKV